MRGRTAVARAPTSCSDSRIGRGRGVLEPAAVPTVFPAGAHVDHTSNHSFPAGAQRACTRTRACERSTRSASIHRSLDWFNAGLPVSLGGDTWYGTFIGRPPSRVALRTSQRGTRATARRGGREKEERRKNKFKGRRKGWGGRRVIQHPSLLSNNDERIDVGWSRIDALVKGKVGECVGAPRTRTGVSEEREGEAHTWRP